MATDSGDRYALGVVIVNLGRCCFYQGDIDSAVRFLDQAKTLVEKDKFFDIILDESQARIEIYLTQNKFDEAIKLGLEASKEAKRIGNQMIETDVLLILGHSYLKGNMIAKALAIVEEVSQMTKVLKNRYLYGKLLYLKGLCASQGDRRDKLLKDARSIFEELGAKLDVGRVDRDLLRT